ncbi:hypothetical protein [Arthrobacter sp.]|uniref:hypothetical protein n=1 Tax=Arthrobacter sp. TaxID=1667 RepID=UPI002811B44A|nr:hypothetical protein [Arthrobacter sp.]
MLATAVTVANPDRVVATYPTFFFTVGEGHIAAATQIAEPDGEVFLIVVKPYTFLLHDMSVTDKIDGNSLVVLVVFTADFDGSSTISLNFQLSLVVVAAMPTVVVPVIPPVVPVIPPIVAPILTRFLR